MILKVLFEGVHEHDAPKNPKLRQHFTSIYSSVTLIKATEKGEKNIVIDTSNYHVKTKLISALKKEGLTPAKIDYVINTHAHFDHISNNYLFPCPKILYGSVWYADGTLDDYKTVEDIEIPCVHIIPAPGHKEEHISVVVKIKNSTYVIAGDAIRENAIRNKTVSAIEIESARKILALADVIIPGHGRIIQGKILEELRTVMGV